MPWCPKCRYEYVKGKTICPDCGVELVDELPLSISTNETVGTINNESVSNDTPEIDYQMGQVIQLLKDKGYSDDEITQMMELMQNNLVRGKQSYKPVSEKYDEHKAGAPVLIVCGIIGVVFLILNAFGIINLPLSGFSLILTYFVMGGLFIIFVLSGIKSIFSLKKLAPKVEEEKELIDKVVNYLKDKKNSGMFEINNEGISFEEMSIIKSNIAIQACERDIQDLPPGFSYYVTDRYYSEIFEDEN